MWKNWLASDPTHLFIIKYISLGITYGCFHSLCLLSKICLIQGFIHHHIPDLANKLFPLFSQMFGFFFLTRSFFIPLPIYHHYTPIYMAKSGKFRLLTFECSGLLKFPVLEVAIVRHWGTYLLHNFEQQNLKGSFQHSNSAFCCCLEWIKKVSTASKTNGAE